MINFIIVDINIICIIKWVVIIIYNFVFICNIKIMYLLIIN